MSHGRIMIMAGGTGGHLFPALAVADYLRERGVEVRWLGAKGGMESRLVPKHDFAIDYISIGGLRGKGVLGWLLAPYKINIAIFQALRLMMKFKPDAVLGMGGFVTGPGGVAALIMGKPLIIHEQNAIAGLTNRLLSKIADYVLQAFPNALKANGVKTVGNPIRQSICQIEQSGEKSGTIRLLIIGGSLGAQALNETVPQAVAQLDSSSRPEIWHQCGERHIDAAKAVYDEAGVEAKVIPFIDDMADAYRWADLVLCRAGALTVSELAAAGVPSILVPFPYAVDDHQTANGQFLVNAGGAEMVQQSELNSERLGTMLASYCMDPEAGRKALQKMAQQAKNLAKPESTAEVSTICAGAMGIQLSEVA
ncbi:MAG: undecaprenyldiphospho-muramoylpentapeptide beta-N-acetylglucosaminyltransferase [Chromatiales bacterium]|nr:undecaprenyldiphospho-muramoylpentapeptide beta-N-acetylglucosaminyltransferase [Chromatiales bacterium]